MKSINRRSFLTGTAAAGLGVAALGLAGCSSSESDSGSAAGSAAEESSGEGSTTTSYSPTETVECDLVVVGSGNSGMSACLEAVDQGLSVVLLEKESVLGGTLPGTEGLLGVGSQLQTDEGTELPKIHELVDEELDYTNYRTDPLLWNDVISNSGENIDWLTDHGVTFDGFDDYLGQSAYDTFHWWTGGTGTEAAETLGTAVTDAGVNVMLSTPAVDLKIEDGAVVGVYAENENGDIIEVDASAVLLATGGMANDLDLLQEKTGLDMSTASSLYPINEVGDGLNMAVSAGAEETAVSYMSVWSVSGYASTDPITVGGCTQPVSLYINQNGERFLCETLCKDKFYALLDNAFRTQDAAYSVIDQNLVDIMENEGCYIGIASVSAGDKLEGFTDQLQEAAGTEGSGVYMGETVEELAEAMGIDSDTLVATVDRYNELCAAGEDEDFGKDAEYLLALETGPYYAITPTTCVFQTMGGIKINRDMQVLNEAGEVISGLYSSGTASCGLYKETYCYQVSGGMNCYCLYTGRHAAQVIAQNI